MSAIVTKYVADHKLNKEISNEEFSQHTPALLELLTDRVKRNKGRQRFQEGYGFSKEQTFLLISSQRTGRSKSQEISKEEG
ncbi:5514_t:CDS:1, partial [Racocetra persica]